MSDAKVTLRSYRPAFELERRIHRIDRFRIPVPYGIPLVGIAYAAAAGVVLVVASGLPVLGTLLGMLPLPVRVLFLPVAAAHVLCRMRPDGRRAHEALLSRLRRAVIARHLVALRSGAGVGEVELPPAMLVPDGRGTVYRRAIVRGPATVLLRLPARAEARGRTLAVSALAGAPMYRGYELHLRDGQRLRLR